MSAESSQRSVPGGTRARAVVAVVAAALASCQAVSPWTRGGVAGSDERQIQMVATDFVTDHYVRRLRTREITVYCVGLRPVGRLQPGPDLLEVARREDRWDPAGNVIRFLQQGQDREVRPLSECTWDAQTREIHEESGAGAISFVAGPVRFETPNLALVTVEARESGQEGGRFGCRVERRADGWTVDTCV